MAVPFLPIAAAASGIAQAYTSRRQAKAAQRALDESIRRLEEGKANSIADLRRAYSKSLNQASQGLELSKQERKEVEGRFDDYIAGIPKKDLSDREAILDRLTTDMSQAFSGAKSEISGLLGEARTGVESEYGRSTGALESLLSQAESKERGAFEQAVDPKQVRLANELNAYLSSQGVSPQGSTFQQGLAAELAKINEQRFALEQGLSGRRFQTLGSQVLGRQGNLLDLIRQGLDTRTGLTQSQLQSQLGQGQYRAGVTREDLINQRNREIASFAEKLGVARGNEQTARGFENTLRYATPIDLESNIANIRLGAATVPINIASQAAQLAQARREQAESGLGAFLGSYAQNTEASAQNQQYMDLLRQIYSSRNKGTAGTINGF